MTATRETENQAGRAPDAREERAYTLAVQALLWARPFVEYLRTFEKGDQSGWGRRELLAQVRQAQGGRRPFRGDAQQRVDRRLWGSQPRS